MDREKLVQKIIRFPLIVHKMTNDLLLGDFRSIFRGHGIEVDEVRLYESGDDVRAIDWNVSARFGTPYLKIYREERDQTVFIILDCSSSMNAGGLVRAYDQAVLVLALMAFSAEYAGQPVGALFFNQKITTVFPSRKGSSHTMMIINAALQASLEGNNSNLSDALTGAGRLLKRRSFVVVISDFQSLGWERSMDILCRHHEVVAVRINASENLSGAGLVSVTDPETGATVFMPTRHEGFRGFWQLRHKEQQDKWQARCRQAGAVPLSISTADNVVECLVKFFKHRS
ncbi:MAG: DUF58 domain-containing protein [Spirochaetaceae bacterium]|jgi:uncharacterized protein (DUF58 family)|nr:DUF58 domain-containing protein [Spirochaetaceae bacterium]